MSEELDTQTEEPDPYDLRPVQRTDGSGLWDALDANGYGHVLGVEFRGTIEIWLAGYEVGARDRGLGMSVKVITNNVPGKTNERG